MPNDTMPRVGLLVSQNAPQYMEATRLGLGWSTLTATPFTAIAARPTTTANLEIWNNSASGVNLIVDRISFFQLLSTAATQTYSVWAQVTAPKAVPTLTALVIGSQNGSRPYTSALGTRVVTGAETTVVANTWQPFGSVQAWGTAAATPGNAFHAEVSGRLIVPPGCSLCVAGVGSLATASTLHVGAAWYEVPVNSLGPVIAV